MMKTMKTIGMIETKAGEQHINAHCMICNEAITNSMFVSLSDESVKESHRDLIDSIITQILEQHSDGAILQSDTLCETCFHSFKQVHDTETKLQVQKLKLQKRFRTSKGHLSIFNHTLGEYTEPKKVLNIPSSDEEEESNCIDANDEIEDKKLKTIEEIEVELEKIHGPGNDICLENIKSKIEESNDVVDEIISGDNKQNAPEFIKINPIDEEEENERKVRNDNKSVFEPGQSKNDKRKLPKEMKDKYCAFDIVTRNQNLYTCMLCEGDETVCGEAKAIVVHVREAHDQRLYICDYCGDFFRKRNELSTHIDEHVENEDGDFQCESCNRIFSNLRLFRIHKRMHQPQNKSWTCSRCGKKYGSRNLLEEHMNTHTGRRPYQCPECSKDFASKYTFRAHLKTHESRERPFSCTLCAKTFLNMSNLTQHEKTHSGVKDFACEQCDKRFASAHNLEVHSVVHANSKPFVCGLCGKSFARKGEIRDHERTHTGERPYQCEVCQVTFTQRSNLQTHKRATHFGDKRYKCELCGRAFKRRRLLDYHTKAAHTGERPYKCTKCDATFVYPEHFKKHQRIHTGEKPFACEVCGKAFNSRDNRNAHRFIHSEKKPYECMACGAGFMRKPLLYQHMEQEKHVNDAIIINQARVPGDDGGDVFLRVVDDQLKEDAQPRKPPSSSLSDTEKLFIVEHMLVDEDDDDDDGDDDDDDDSAASKDSEQNYILGQDEDDPTIIIDGQSVRLKGENAEEDNNGQELLSASEDDFHGILTPDVIAGAQTQIIQTKDGPIQLLAVRIPNDDGEEEEAWIKILPEHIAE